MKKLTAAIQYECFTSFRYIWIFYLVQYLIVALICLIVAVGTGSFENIGTNCLELNTFIYVGILGALGFKEDFKMLIQNGFTRRYIFLATLSLFVFITGIMSLVDTIVGNVLHFIFPGYSTLFGSLYGYGHFLANWLWLLLLYMIVCSLFYLCILAISRLGKTGSICLGLVLGGGILAAAALIRFGLSDHMVTALNCALLKAMGFMNGGNIVFFPPLLTFLVLTCLLCAGSYLIIRRAELN